MKPLHIGLLVVGAALAGGLAVKMTELPPVPAVPSETIPVVARSAPVFQPAPATPAQPVPAAPSAAKPSPIPRRVAPAPAPIYAAPWKAAVPKSRPVTIAKARRPAYPPPPPYTVPRLEPRAAHSPDPAPQPPPAPEPDHPLHQLQRKVTLLAGMTIPVRLTEFLSTDHSVAGDAFHASLAEPLVVDGLVIAERGARVEGRIVGTQRVARANGASSLDLELISIETSDGQKVEIPTDPWTRRGDRAYGRPASVSPDTVIPFRLTSQVTITERQL